MFQMKSDSSEFTWNQSKAGYPDTFEFHVKYNPVLV